MNEVKTAWSSCSWTWAVIWRAVLADGQYLLLGEREGGELDQAGQQDDGEAVGIWHMR